MAKDKAQIRILTRSEAPFQDREDAGKLLARELSEYRGQNVVVLGIPRGGVAVAREIARELNADMDIVLAHKLGAPGHPELAMGAIAETGEVYLNDRIIADLNIDNASIEQEKKKQLAELKRRSSLFRAVKIKVPLAGKVAIVADDGVATGATTQAAIRAVKSEKPRLLVLAIPVGPEDTLRRLAEDADEIVCLKAPPFFGAVGQFYERFAQVEDEEVLDILKHSRKREM